MTNRADALKEAFAGANSPHTDALRGIPLPPRQSPNRLGPEAALTAATPPAEHHDADGPDAGTVRPRLESIPADNTTSTDDEQPGSGSTIVYVTPRVRDALRRRAAADPETTFTDLVLDALETHEHDLRDTWAGRRRPQSRFTRTPARRPRRDEPGVQLALRLTTSNLAELDAMVAEVLAPSRTALVEQALRLYLRDDLEHNRPAPSGR